MTLQLTLGGLTGNGQPVWLDVMTAILKVTSYQKSDSVSRCVFPWRTILPNFTPIRFEMTEP